MWLLLAEMLLVLVIAGAIVTWTMAGRKRADPTQAVTEAGSDDSASPDQIPPRP